MKKLLAIFLQRRNRNPHMYKKEVMAKSLLQDANQFQKQSNLASTALVEKAPASTYCRCLMLAQLATCRCRQRFADGLTALLWRHRYGSCLCYPYHTWNLGPSLLHGYREDKHMSTGALSPRTPLPPGCSGTRTLKL